MFWAPLLSLYNNDRPINWTQLFGRVAPLEIEIGAGLGEYLTERALENPSCDFVGIECDPPRVSKILQKLNSSSFPNVRIFQADAKLIFSRFIQPKSVSFIYSLFPCPWPKRKHAKYRLFSTDFLRLLNNRLVDDGTLKIVTDHLPYARWIESQGPQAEFKFEIRKINPQFNTKFERKWLAMGQQEFYELFVRKQKHVDVKLQEDTPLRQFKINDFIPDRFHPQYYKGGEGSIIFKEFSYDAAKQKAFIHAIIVEPDVDQQVWFMIARKAGSWVIAPLAGGSFIPTPGVLKTLELIYEAALQSTQEHAQ